MGSQKSRDPRPAQGPGAAPTPGSMTIFEFSIARHFNQLVLASETRELTPGEVRFMEKAQPLIRAIESKEAAAG